MKELSRIVAETGVPTSGIAVTLPTTEKRRLRSRLGDGSRTNPDLFTGFQSTYGDKTIALLKTCSLLMSFVPAGDTGPVLAGPWSSDGSFERLLRAIAHGPEDDAAWQYRSHQNRIHRPCLVISPVAAPQGDAGRLHANCMAAPRSHARRHSSRDPFVRAADKTETP